MPSEQVIAAIRTASRAMVRELGFTSESFAGTSLSPSAVHTLIEIENQQMTARELGALLKLEKSSVSRLLRRLIQSGDISESIDKRDARSKVLSLTSVGKKRVAAIHAFAQSQVKNALEHLGPGDDKSVLKGLQLYSRGLSGQAGENAKSVIDIVTGYKPGLIGRIAEMHGRYYAREVGFGKLFESRVAIGISEFFSRPESSRSKFWSAWRDGEIVGSVAIDGDELDGNAAKLHWYILDDSARGEGVGKRLLDAALAFVDEQGFACTRLETLASLHAAIYLYKSRGFQLVEERIGSQWGKEVLEQTYERPAR